MSKLSNIKILFLLITISFVIFHSAQSANILFFCGLASYSHRVAMWPLVEALAEKGHNVTFFFGQVPKNTHPKVIEFSPNDMVNFNERLGLGELDMIKKRLTSGRADIDRTWPHLIDMGVKLCEIILTDPNALHFVNNSKFDLVIVDALYNDCALGLAYKFNALHIVYDPSASFMWYPDAYGYSDESSYYPEIQYAYPIPMSFIQRCKNSIASTYWYYLRKWQMFPRLENLFKKHLGLVHIPPFEELEKNVSLVFIQRHFTEELPKAFPPLFVPIGGLHVFKEAKPLTDVTIAQFSYSYA